MTIATDQWFYAIGGARKGPHSPEELAELVRLNVIDGDTLVWVEGLGDWTPMGKTTFGRSLGLSSSLSGPPALGETGGAPPIRGMGDAVRSVLSNYATFSGRANRPEYWYFVLASFLVNLVLVFVVTVAFGREDVANGVSGILSLALLLPSLAVGARRLHDTDRSAWWLLIGLVPIIGFIVLIVFFCFKGTPGRNRFG